LLLTCLSVNSLDEVAVVTYHEFDISDDRDLLGFIMRRGVWKEYKQGDTISSETGPFQGIHLIVHGLVKVSVLISLRTIEPI